METTAASCQFIDQVSAWACAQFGGNEYTVDADVASEALCILFDPCTVPGGSTPITFDCALVVSFFQDIYVPCVLEPTGVTGTALGTDQAGFVLGTGTVDSNGIPIILGVL